jgi:enoyl-CoA hydratase/carnithine racemase
MPVTREIVDGVLHIRLDRPDKRNAIDRDMALGLDNALEALDRDESVRCGVLAAIGPVFSAGTDLFDPRDKTTPAGGEYGLLRRQRLKPLIAAVAGPALGGGFEIALACDLIVASVAATFGLPETRRGLVATGGGLFRTAAAVPRQLAAELLLTGSPITAERALSAGLVNRLVAAGEAEDEAHRLACKIAECAPYATGLTLAALRGAVAADEEVGWSITREAREKVLAGPEAAEGKRAFAERRAPSWAVPPAAAVGDEE